MRRDTRFSEKSEFSSMADARRDRWEVKACAGVGDTGAAACEEWAMGVRSGGRSIVVDRDVAGDTVLVERAEQSPMFHSSTAKGSHRRGEYVALPPAQRHNLPSSQRQLPEPERVPRSCVPCPPTV